MARFFSLLLQIDLSSKWNLFANSLDELGSSPYWNPFWSVQFLTTRLITRKSYDLERLDIIYTLINLNDLSFTISTNSADFYIFSFFEIIEYFFSKSIWTSDPFSINTLILRSRLLLLIIKLDSKSLRGKINFLITGIVGSITRLGGRWVCYVDFIFKLGYIAPTCKLVSLRRDGSLWCHVFISCII